MLIELRLRYVVNIHKSSMCNLNGVVGSRVIRG